MVGLFGRKSRAVFLLPVRPCVLKCPNWLMYVGCLSTEGAFLTRLWVAKHRRAAAEGGAAAIITDAATATAHTAPPCC